MIRSFARLVSPRIRFGFAFWLPSIARRYSEPMAYKLFVERMKTVPFAIAEEAQKRLP